jgi:3-keto-5-aminohexanoate cleavage enzyme
MSESGPNDIAGDARDAVWSYSDPREYVRRVARGLEELPPLIITVAITGGVHGKESNENLPETLEEQAHATYDAWQAGATMVHIHARRPENPSMTAHDSETYYAVNRAIREACPDIIINNTMAGDLVDTVDGHERFHTGSLYANPETACGTRR